MNWAKGLQISNGVDAGKILIEAEELSVGGLGLKDVSLVADIAVDLESGLSEAADTWYSVWIEAITRGQKTRLRGILGDAATAPTPHADVTRLRRVSWALNDPSQDFFSFENAVGSHWFRWNEDERALPFEVLNVTTSGIVPTDVPCAGAAPPTADELRIEGKIFSGAATGKTLYIRSNDLPNILDPAFIEGTGKRFSQMGNMECDENQIIEYWTISAAHDVIIRVTAYHDKR